MRKAHHITKKARHSRRSSGPDYMYSIYSLDYFSTKDYPGFDEDSHLCHTFQDPFKCFGIGWMEACRFAFVTRIGKRVNGRFIEHAAISKVIGDFSMEVMPSKDKLEYRTCITYSERASEFPIEDKLFNLWEVQHNKRTSILIDFTCQYDSTMVLSLFGNRLGLRLDKGPTQIPDDKKPISVHRARYAVAYKE